MIININDTVVILKNFNDATEKEAINYYNYVKEHVNSSDTISKIEVTLTPDDMVDIHYKIQGVKFERIRRITGYLTGSLDFWNDAKRAEERDRVKHANFGTEKNESCYY